MVLTRHRPGDRGWGAVDPAGLLRLARWGLVPSWSPDTKRGRQASSTPRAETITELLARLPLRGPRPGGAAWCPADGWYEWGRRRRTDPARQPTYLTPRDGGLLAFARPVRMIWGFQDRLLTSSDRDHRGDRRAGGRCTHRCRWCCRGRPWAAWPDPGREDVAELLVPDPGAIAGLELRPVGPAVGTVANDGPGLIERVHPVPPSGSLAGT